MLPSAVREQAERAERLHQEFLGNTAVAAPDQTLVPPAEPTPVETVVLAEELVPVAPQEPVVQPTVEDDSWRLKYLALNGKYVAEVPRLAEEVRQLKHERDGLKQQLEARPVANAPGADLPSGQTTESVVSTYGEDFVSAVSTIANAQAKAIRDEFSSDVEVLKADAGTRARDTFLRDLTAAVPSWQRIDAEAGFTAFLDEYDPMTGRLRREFFNEADRSNDAARIANFFATYAKSNTPVPKAAAVPPPSMEHLVVPDSSASSEAPVGKKLWTQSEVQQFYRDARNKKYTPAEYARIDADITAANAEGRYLG